LGKDGTIVFLPALDLDELLDQLPSPAVQIVLDGFALGLKT